MHANSVSVVIPTFRRSDQLLKTLAFIAQCSPPPKEILVHIDAGDEETPSLLEKEFPNVIQIQSTERQGPGGGRNKLIAAATHECIVSLDDDSWPLALRFFAQASGLIENHPLVAVFSCFIVESDGDIDQEVSPADLPTDSPELKPSSGFVGCGAIVRRSAFVQTRGYLPLKNAYGLEETDLALQLIDLGWEMRSAPHLQVFHACDRQQHHSSPGINSAHIRNSALLVFLRYPLRYFLYGSLQVVNRVVFSLRNARFRGILWGLCSIPFVCWKYRHERHPVSIQTMKTMTEVKTPGS